MRPHDSSTSISVTASLYHNPLPGHAVRVSGEGEVLIYTAEERTAYGFGLNSSEPIGRAAFHERVRAIAATQAAAPGFFVVAEESAATVLRSHDLSVCARLADAGGTVASVVINERGQGRLEVVLGLESGAVATWVVDCGL